VVGDDEAEHGVTEELQPLVGPGAVVLRAPRPVRDGAGEQVLVAEGATQALGERLERGREGDQGL
jgi:hypothetical protein